MTRLDKGNNLAPAVPQAGRTIVETAEGTLEGSVTWKINNGNITPATVDSDISLPKVATNDGAPGAPHPDDNRLECYNRTITFGPNDVITCVASYFGLVRSQTIPTLSFTGGVTTEPIETHPKFEEFGTAENGAQFDSETGAFLNFTKFVEAGDPPRNDDEFANFMGVDNYLRPATNITISWWEDKKPRPSKLATIRTVFPYEANLRKPANVTDFLLIDESIRQVGNFYEITQNYMGSESQGWNAKIYDTPST